MGLIPCKIVGNSPKIFIKTQFDCYGCGQKTPVERQVNNQTKVYLPKNWEIYLST
jgi:hypothetical protein